MTTRPTAPVFIGLRFPPQVITAAVRWYLRYGLSYCRMLRNCWPTAVLPLTTSPSTGECGGSPRSSPGNWARRPGPRRGPGPVRGGPQILAAAARQSPELRDALALWKETKLEFDEVDRLDLADAGSSPERRTSR